MCRTVRSRALLCRCGCDRPPTHRVEGTEFGSPFVEYCCAQVLGYLAESAHEAGDKHSSRPIRPGDDLMNVTQAPPPRPT